MFFHTVFSDHVFNRKLLTLAFPITLQSLMLALVAAADAVMLGKLNQDAMAAVTQVNAVLVGNMGNDGNINIGQADIPAEQDRV